MSGNRKRRWEKFGNNDSSSSSDEESISRFRNENNSSRSKHKITEEESNKLQREGNLLSNNEVVGPALPPNFQRDEQLTVNECNTSSKRSPQLVQKNSTEDIVVGPSLPPHLKKLQTISTDEAIGPSLPPHLLARQTDHTEEVSGPSLPPHLLVNQKACTNEITGPSLLPQLPIDRTASLNKIIGPSLPPHLLVNQKTCTDEITGPSLPPHLQKASTNEVIGPSLPPHLLEHQEDECTELMGPALPPHLLQLPPDITTKGDRIMGPQLPPQFSMANNVDESSDSDGAIGPDPRLMASADQPLDYNVAERAERARKKMLGLDKIKPERENWMLELPPERAANLGLGARQFRGKLAPEMGDRTVWTDTPSDKAKKEGLPPKIDERELGRKQIIAERDRNMEKMARKAEKKLKRKESLLESHSKKMEKEAKDKAKNTKNEPQLRKMFSREEDMQVHKFDEAQKKAIFKKAQFLNDRFSQGESKYL